MANAAPRRPQLRPVETIMVPDARYGQLLVLRDTQGIAPGHACIPPRLAPIVGRFTGELTCEEIAREVTLELGVEVTIDLVEKLADELDESFFLAGPKYRKARARIELEFATASERPASHAGGAYYADAGELTKYLDEECLGKGMPTPA